MTRALLGQLVAAVSGTFLSLSSLPSHPSQGLTPSPSENALSDFPSSTSLNGSIGASASVNEQLGNLNGYEGAARLDRIDVHNSVLDTVLSDTCPISNPHPGICVGMGFELETMRLSAENPRTHTRELEQSKSNQATMCSRSGADCSDCSVCFAHLGEDLLVVPRRSASHSCPRGQCCDKPRGLFVPCSGSGVASLDVAHNVSSYMEKDADADLPDAVGLIYNDVSSAVMDVEAREPHLEQVVDVLQAVLVESAENIVEYEQGPHGVEIEVEILEPEDYSLDRSPNTRCPCCSKFGNSVQTTIPPYNEWAKRSPCCNSSPPNCF